MSDDPKQGQSFFELVIMLVILAATIVLVVSYPMEALMIILAAMAITFVAAVAAGIWICFRPNQGQHASGVH
jgi:hypothetical protein